MGGSKGAKAAKDKPEEKDETEAIRDHFRGKDGPVMSTEIQLRQTLGQGHFGRVRLIESASCAEELQKYSLTHTGQFALKIMKKSEILRLRQNQHVKDERQLLLKMKNPFIITLYHVYQDERNVYMVMEFVKEGELRNLLRAKELFSSDLARFYIAQLVMVLQYMHSEHVVYRGVGTDNLLIDSSGYIKLVDFGFAKFLPPKEEEVNLTYTLCGTPEYLAPEIVGAKGHHKGADWWATGILIFELLAGYPPFYAAEPFDIYAKILTGTYREPVNMDQHAAAIVKKLLHLDMNKRLGCSHSGAEEIKRQKWFRGLDWAAIYNKQMTPPEVPDADMDKFGTYEDSLEESGPLLSTEDAEKFDYWSIHK